MPIPQSRCHTGSRVSRLQRTNSLSSIHTQATIFSTERSGFSRVVMRYALLLSGCGHDPRYSPPFWIPTAIFYVRKSRPLNYYATILFGALANVRCMLWIMNCIKLYWNLKWTLRLTIARSTLIVYLKNMNF